VKNHAPGIRAYVDGVLSGKITAGRLVIAAVERYECDRYAAGARGYTHSAQHANYAINFIELLQHSTGEFAGKPFLLSPWQKFIIWNLFGWLNEAKERRFRWAFISVGRGNGKSPFAAAIANLLTFADRPLEPRAQTYLYATKEKQAKDIVFAEIRNQIRRSPALSRKVKINSRRIHAPDESHIEPCGSDSTTNDGLIPHGAIIDELHEWKSWHRGLFDTIETGMHKRRSAMAIQITTAGTDESELWAEQHDYSTKVVNGVVSADEHFSFIAQVDADDDILDESCWPKANPNLGVSVKIERLRPLAEKALHLPTAAQAFRRYHANYQTVSFYKLIPPAVWNNCAGRLPPEDELNQVGAFLGFDWGWRDDLAAMAIVWPLESDPDKPPHYAIDCTVWIPEECNRNLQLEPWRSWIESGLIQVTSGNTTDIEACYAHLDDLLDRYQIAAMAADPHNCIEFLQRCLRHYGLPVYEFAQNCTRYNEPTRYFVTALLEGRIRHGGHKLLGWAADNITVREDSRGYIMPNKMKSTDKIDPIVATIMAIGAATRDELPSYDYYLTNPVELG
jgi:phage terminase large subunit-like protein